MSCVGLSCAEHGHGFERYLPDTALNRLVGDTVPAVFGRLQTRNPEEDIWALRWYKVKYGQSLKYVTEVILVKETE